MMYDTQSTCEQHCMIIYHSDMKKFTLVNYADAGTVVDGTYVLNDVATLRHNSWIEIGQVQLIFKVLI